MVFVQPSVANQVNVVNWVLTEYHRQLLKTYVNCSDVDSTSENVLVLYIHVEKNHCTGL